MQERYRPLVETLSATAAHELRRWFYLKRDGSLHDAAEMAGLCQADLVLRLLEAGELEAAEHLIGRKITRGRPAQYRGLPPPKLGPDDRRVLVRMAALLKHGQPLRRAIARGVRRKDVTLAVKRGYCVLEELPESRRH